MTLNSAAPTCSCLTSHQSRPQVAGLALQDAMERICLSHHVLLASFPLAPKTESRVRASQGDRFGFLLYRVGQLTAFRSDMDIDQKCMPSTCEPCRFAKVEDPNNFWLPQGSREKPSGRSTLDPGFQ